MGKQIKSIPVENITPQMSEIRLKIKLLFWDLKSVSETTLQQCTEGGQLEHWLLRLDDIWKEYVIEKENISCSV